MSNDNAPHDEQSRPAVGVPVERIVRPLAARLSVLQVLLAEHHPEHHATVAEARAEIERLRAEVARLTEHAVTLANTERHVERERCAAWMESEGRHDLAYGIRRAMHEKA